MGDNSSRRCLTLSMPIDGAYQVTRMRGESFEVRSHHVDQIFGGAARIFLRADKTVPYGDLMDAMNALRRAGYLKVALVGLESDAPR